MINIKSSKKIFSVSKKLFDFLSNPIELTTTKTIASPNCKGCKFKDCNDKFANQYCKEYCEHRNGKKIVIEKYKSKVNLNRALGYTVRSTISRDTIERFKISQLGKRRQAYITPLQSKLMLAYYYISNSNGVINLIEKKDIAKFVGCSVKSIDNCNYILAKYNLITVRKHSKNDLTILINDYEKMYSVNGSGYLVLSTKLFKQLLGIRKLHEFRLALKVIVKSDANLHFSNLTKFSMDTLKAFLPAYKRKASAISAFADRILKTFKSGIIATPFANRQLLFTLDQGFEGKELRDSIKSSNKEKLESFIDNTKLVLTNEDEKINNLVDLSLEYSFNEILNLLGCLTQDILFMEPSKFGGTIRNLLEEETFSDIGLSTLI